MLLIIKDATDHLRLVNPQRRHCKKHTIWLPNGFQLNWPSHTCWEALYSWLIKLSSELAHRFLISYKTGCSELNLLMIVTPNGIHFLQEFLLKLNWGIWLLQLHVNDLAPNNNIKPTVFVRICWWYNIFWSRNKRVHELFTLHCWQHLPVVLE